MTAYNFKKFTDLETLEEVPEGAKVVGIVNDQIVQLDGSGLGGGGIKTAIIKSSDYNDALSGVQPSSTVTYECVNMTFEEAYAIMESGEPLAVCCMYTYNGSAINEPGAIMFATAILGVPCIQIFGQGNLQLYWTADGLSTEEPGGAGPV